MATYIHRTDELTAKSGQASHKTENFPREEILRTKILALFVTVVCDTSAIGADAFPGLKIERAIYSVRDGSIPCEVTTKVASICNGQSECRVPAGNPLCPMGDPAPDSPKILTVNYRCGTTELQSASIPEGQELLLMCK